MRKGRKTKDNENRSSLVIRDHLTQSAFVVLGDTVVNVQAKCKKKKKERTRTMSKEPFMAFW